MSSFKLSVWTEPGMSFPSSLYLAVTEPDSGRRLRAPQRGRRFRSNVPLLAYPIGVRVRELEASPAISPERSLDGRWDDGDSGHNGRPSDWDDSDPPPPPAQARRKRHRTRHRRHPGDSSQNAPTQSLVWRPVLPLPSPPPPPTPPVVPCLAPATVSLLGPSALDHVDGSPVVGAPALHVEPPVGEQVLPVSSEPALPLVVEPLSPPSAPDSAAPMPSVPEFGGQTGPQSPPASHVPGLRDSVAGSPISLGCQTSPSLWCSGEWTLPVAPLLSPMRGLPPLAAQAVEAQLAAAHVVEAHLAAAHAAEAQRVVALVEVSPFPPLGQLSFVDSMSHLVVDQDESAPLPLSAPLSPVDLGQFRTSVAVSLIQPAPGPPLDTFLRCVQINLEKPLLSSTLVVRHRNTVAPGFSSCRSPRLASLPMAACPNVRKAQGVLMLKLGISSSGNAFSDADLQRYKAKFDHPLRQVDIEALAALFNLRTSVEAGSA
ncbi:hypothetical protein BRADI_4g32815v3 [Brachypodium distachyon]|uniref:Uncharacterized protein n=1 Tax=Brachypodium distachyon TaxID=15368 RepID=A0A2K2CRW0_BRADI|nr:hypothetical protein BRADI_4g32815v3 [Brachypodium distachyon]